MNVALRRIAFQCMKRTIVVVVADAVVVESYISERLSGIRAM